MQFYLSSTDAWDGMIAAIEAAETSILFEEYAYDDDVIGRRFTNTLIRKANEGVDIRLLLDGWGCYGFSRSDMCRELENAGVDICFFRPLSFERIITLKFFPRDHRKLLITDRETVLVGGVCVYDAITGWRDTMLELTEPHITEQCIELFEDTWVRAHGNDKAKKALYEQDGGEDDLTIYANTPSKGSHFFTDKLLQRIHTARNVIRMTTPYFTPHEALLEALYDAAARNVKVELLLSDYSKFGPYVVGKHMAGTLIDNGVHIYYYKPSMLHLKMMIIDNDWAALGSCNLDGLSIKQNEEMMLVTNRTHMIEVMHGHFDHDLSQCERMRYADWRRRPLLQKIAGHALMPMRRYL